MVKVLNQLLKISQKNKINTLKFFLNEENGI